MNIKTKHNSKETIVESNSHNVPIISLLAYTQNSDNLSEEKKMQKQETHITVKMMTSKTRELNKEIKCAFYFREKRLIHC